MTDERLAELRACAEDGTRMMEAVDEIKRLKDQVGHLLDQVEYLREALELQGPLLRRVYDALQSLRNQMQTQFPWPYPPDLIMALDRYQFALEQAQDAEKNVAP